MLSCSNRKVPYMAEKWTIAQGVPYPLGASVSGNDINFATVLHSDKECGLILYDKNGAKERIPFLPEHRIGNICCVCVKNAAKKIAEYNYYEGETIVVDPYAKVVRGNEAWNSFEENTVLRSGLNVGMFDWQGDKNLRIPYEDSVFYLLHTRGFTKGKNSGVKAKGTFKGIIEKITYFKELGVRNLEFMPVYEFNEVILPSPKDQNESMQYAVTHYMDKPETEIEGGKAKRRMNYWGYTNAYYFAPKASYAYGKNPVQEFKEMVRELHRNGIEVICQFYFPEETKPGYILEVLRYWVMEYHIDGIHLMGLNIPITLIATDPLFSNTKLIYYHFPYDQIYAGNEIPDYRNLAAANDDFMNHARKYLKSDEDMIGTMMGHFIENNAKNTTLHYVTNYYGFTLADLVSYDYKHNEDNGEDNRDGNDYNYSWNCGVEGPTKKSSVLKLRRKQIYNAMIMTVLSQGTPFLTAGDEDLNSQLGNNNPYCQDNAIGYKDWNRSKKSTQQYDFVRRLLAFRKEHSVFRKKEGCVLTDYRATGIPEVSFHSDEAFRVKAENYNRHMGILYSGAYGNQKKETDCDIYIAYNMHWNEHSFALPKARKGEAWSVAIDTSCENPFEPVETEQNEYVTLQGRSIAVLISRKCMEESV